MLRCSSGFPGSYYRDYATVKYSQGSPEDCTNGIDDDGDGDIDCFDSDCPDSPTTYYADADGDTYGDPYNFRQYCSQPTGYVTDNTDCDDTDGAVNPAATEVCDGIDNNCDGQIDEGVKTTYYRDADGDGFGDPANTVDDCTQPAGYVTDNTDCNDADANEHPGQTWYKDADGDGYSDGTTTTSCTRPSGYKLASELTPGTDCNDGDPAINPAATEVCDGIDNNCDGQIDEGVKTTYYQDADGDGYGNPAVSNEYCEGTQPAGYVLDNTDCNDADANEHPGQTWYQDADGDGYGNPAVSVEDCTQPASYVTEMARSAPAGYVSDNTDCDDTNAAVNPGAQEICNDGIDNDCDGLVDCDDPDCLELSIDVHKAKVDFDKPGKAKDKVKLDACFSNVCMPEASDLITVVFDGVTLLSVPFSSFEEEDDEPGEYEYKEKKLHVEIDFTEGKIKVKRKKMDLSGLDNSDGVDVDISFGIATGTDHFVMKEKSKGGKKKGKRKRGRDDDDDDDKKKWSYKEKERCGGDDDDDNDNHDDD